MDFGRGPLGGPSSFGFDGRLHALTKIQSYSRWAAGLPEPVFSDSAAKALNVSCCEYAMIRGMGRVQNSRFLREKGESDEDSSILDNRFATPDAIDGQSKVQS